MSAKSKGFIVGVAAGMVIHYAYVNASKRTA